MAPPFRKPERWDKFSAAEKVTYQRQVARVDDKMSQLLGRLHPMLHPDVAEKNRAKIEGIVAGLPEHERERFDALLAEAAKGGAQ